MEKYRPVDLLSIFLVALFFLFPLLPLSAQEPSPEEIREKGLKERRVTLDFNNVDLPVFIKFISELIGKNFAIDEKVKGKVTIFSPSRMTIERAYDLFLSVLELKGFMVVSGDQISQIVPVAELPPERAVRVYSLENTSAEEMAKLLLGLAAKGAAPARRAPRPSGELTGTVQVLADKATNSLIITATNEDYEVIKKVIQKVDMKRRQVFVEAVVLELNADKTRDLGTDLSAVFGYRTPNGQVAAIGGINQNPTDLIALAQVPGVRVGTVNIQALLHALESRSDVNVLSTPQILTSDNQKAEIVVAENIPFPGAQSQTVGGNVQTTIERKDVGIILRLTPQVLENDQVKLDLYQEISSVVDTSQSVGGVVLGPTTNKRSANTSVIVHHAETAVIGGLIRDDIVVTERKIPLLGDIPLLGWLFHFKSKQYQKTNLVIFLTPYLVREEADLERIKEKRIEKAAAFLEENALDRREVREEMFKEMVNAPK
ncbi:MAG TPA: secretin N-terminal domain-containing protein [Candidatus Manganitrophaceae bacterium]|nr:secretin N-terminal domain-containing protein [Candidatus Manganitrophaceae bacterium]